MNPDLVTVGIGINDIGHGLTLDQFSKNYEQILSTLKEKTSARIVVTNIPDISSCAANSGSRREMSISSRLFSSAVGWRRLRLGTV